MTSAIPTEKISDSVLAKLRRFIASVLRGPKISARSETMDLQLACCGLLMELARLDAAGAERKRKAVSRAMWEEFGIADEELASMIKRVGRPENRLTSYYRPIATINRNFAPDQKAQFIERLWRVALADGEIDMYEEQLVRKFADLLYVSHADFILAKHRVQGGGAARAS